MSEPSIKKMRRAKSERLIAGVCGGIAKYFFIDPVIIRGLFILLGLLNGIGVVLYIGLAIVMPEEGEEEGTVSGVTTVSIDVPPAPQVAAPAGSPQDEATLRQRRQLLLLLLVGGLVLMLSPIILFFSFLGFFFGR